MLLTHSPFQPVPGTPRWDPKMGERDGNGVKHFAAMTAFMDKMAGLVVANLKALGLRENTRIFL